MSCEKHSENKYYKKSPCNNCPYRLDAPLQLWDKIEFMQLLMSGNELLGTVYRCHKNDGHVCVGWLMKQDENRFPSIMLRISLSKHSVTREYLNSLHCDAGLYESVEEMIKSNYPELLPTQTK